MDREQQDAIELGTASEATLGGLGPPTDFVRGIPSAAGLSDD